MASSGLSSNWWGLTKGTVMLRQRPCDPSLGCVGSWCCLGTCQEKIGINGLWSTNTMRFLSNQGQTSCMILVHKPRLTPRLRQGSTLIQRLSGIVSRRGWASNGLWTTIGVINGFTATIFLTKDESHPSLTPVGRQAHRVGWVKVCDTLLNHWFNI